MRGGPTAACGRSDRQRRTRLQALERRRHRLLRNSPLLDYVLADAREVGRDRPVDGVVVGHLGLYEQRPDRLRLRHVDAPVRVEALRRSLDDGHVEQRQQLPGRLADDGREPLGARRELSGPGLLAALARGRSPLGRPLSALAAGAHLGLLALDHPPVEDERRQQAVLQQRRQPPDDAEDVRHRGAVGGRVRRGVGELHGRREVAVQPVVGVHGDDRARDLVVADLADGR